MKNRKIFLSFSIVVIIGLQSLGLARDAAPTTATLMAEVYRIMGNIKDTKYQHETRVLEEKGSYHVDCSGFVGYVLMRACPNHFEQMRKTMSRRRLTASNYFNFFDMMRAKPKTDWVIIDDAAHIQPGDIIVWKKEPPAPGNTGHIMFADSASTQTASRQFSVAIIDSTTKPHSNDTRKQGQTGLGRGVIWLDTDEQNRPIGYRRNAPDSRLTAAPIIIVRLKKSE
ncbi:MAG TPA: hypothetical protein PLS31_10570 [Candidatus Sumerlaeota bacterium]|nr:MAG: hypothetical protein BWY12_00426 [candidate division BRC1 bacterium ADurb.Bin183]HQH12859.1 hypothetical protein [Candidatus Sumerlaeota bacterium]HRR32037.1 hypothetical protein [Candidatus Sumerlaeia bacterium]HRR99994.1 hypothetical protein [Candidatus Sumerlaeia bacterium]